MRSLACSQSVDSLPLLQELEVPKGTHISLGGGVRGKTVPGLSGLSPVDLPSALRDLLPMLSIWSKSWTFLQRLVMLNQHENEFVRDQMCRVRCGHKICQVGWSTF